MNKKENILGIYGLGDYNSQQIKVFVRSFELEGLSPKKFHDRRPDSHPDPDKYIRQMSPKTATLIIPDTFAGQMGVEILENMSLDQLEQIGIDGDSILKLAVQDALQRSDQSNPRIKDIKKYIINSPAWQM